MAKRKRIEEPFGWMKTVGLMRKTRHRGRSLVKWFFVLTAAAYNQQGVTNLGCIAARRGGVDDRRRVLPEVDICQSSGRR